MGVLFEVFLQFLGVYCSIYLIYLVFVIGKYVNYLIEVYYFVLLVFGIGLLWQCFYELNGKVLGIGILMGLVIFYYLFEDMMGEDFLVKVWMDEIYCIFCKGWNGEDYFVFVCFYWLEIMLNWIDYKL